MAIVALMGKRVIEKGKTWTKKETSLADYAYTYLKYLVGNNVPLPTEIPGTAARFFYH